MSSLFRFVLISYGGIRCIRWLIFIGLTRNSVASRSSLNKVVYMNSLRKLTVSFPRWNNTVYLNKYFSVNMTVHVFFKKDDLHKGKRYNNSGFLCIIG